MSHFKNITSFAELKKQYRTLAIANHPDKGGDTETMQEINAEFDKLFKVWEHRKDETTSRTGYETDFDGATSTQYKEYVYNEYRWVGSRYKGQNNDEILDSIRQWLKETYPRCKFSVRYSNYSTFHINLITADFEVFTEDNNNLMRYGINHYHLDKDTTLTERAREVLTNVNNYIMSYNFDDSDPMTDYFCTNFYLYLGIGRHDRPFEVVVPQLACPKGKEAPLFKFPEGKTHKAIRQALNGSYFEEYKFKGDVKCKVLGDTHYHSDKSSFYPKSYSAPKTAQKRIDKLQAAGINCHLSDYYIVFDGYSRETLKALEEEMTAERVAKERWEIEQTNPKEQETKEEIKTNKRQKTTKQEQDNKENKEKYTPKIDGDNSTLKLVDYSEKSFAIIGETKPIKDLLKNLGGRFNPCLSCGAGWVFSKARIESVKEALKIA